MTGSVPKNGKDPIRCQTVLLSIGREPDAVDPHYARAFRSRPNIPGLVLVHFGRTSGRLEFYQIESVGGIADIESKHLMQD